MAVTLLEVGVDSLKMNKLNGNKQGQLDFVIQQLKLVVKSELHRHYSP
jgi:hypothetical protein